MTPNYTDAKFDAIRKLPADSLVGIRMGWSHPDLAALVAEYDAALAASDRSELLKMAASIAARRADEFTTDPYYIYEACAR